MIFGEAMSGGEILRIFEQEIGLRGGKVLDRAEHEGRVYGRSVLPAVEEVRPKDHLQGGVAIRAGEGQVWVHPYIFRLVCSNGAIMATAVQTRHVVLADMDLSDAAEVLREAVASCCEREAFSLPLQQMRSANDRATDLLINLMSHLSRIPAMHGALLRQAMEHYATGRDQSRFELMNAVTATARETRDPELRWRLEELGGAVAANRLPGRTPRNTAAKIRAVLETVA